MLSFAVPGTVIGIGYILAVNSHPLLLTGTLLILLLNFIFRYVPVGIQSGVAILRQVDLRYGSLKLVSFKKFQELLTKGKDIPFIVFHEVSFPEEFTNKWVLRIGRCSS